MKHTISVIAVFGASILGVLWFWHWRQGKLAAAAQNALGVDPATLPTVPQGTAYTSLTTLNPGVYAQNEQSGTGGIANFDLSTELQSVQAQLGNVPSTAIVTPQSITSQTQGTVTPGNATVSAGSTPFAAAGVPLPAGSPFYIGPSSGNLVLSVDPIAPGTLLN